MTDAFNVTIGNRSVRLFAALLLLGAMTLGAAGCGNDGDDHEDHDHGTHMNDNDNSKTKDASTVSGDDYPLDVCVVSGEKLGSMGKPIIMQHEGRKVRLCCKGCVEDFNKEPMKFLAKLDAAKAK